MTEKVYAQERRYPRASLPNGMPVAWLGSDLQFFSRVQTIGMGGLFIATPNPAPVGTKLRLTFQVPGGSVLPEAIVRNVAPGSGMGVEFTRMEPSERSLLENLMERLLR
ncbi:MAG TPA: PilZ domain-containing protein [Candidatus Acidoferrum sp.]|jgi:PilZ domain|nr:PilZ domain-containing protein [Candidatus Acidoferrum sp.]